jgi:hypothetical protein
MRARPYSVFFLLLALAVAQGLCARGAEVEIGDSEADVIDALDRPMGRFKSGNRDILLYDRGTIEMEDGVVVTVSIVSHEEARRLEAARQQKAEDLRFAREVERARLIQEGEAEKMRITADPSYRGMSAKDMVRYWDNFKAKYPEVSIDMATYQTAKKQLSEQQAQQRIAAEEALPPKPKLSSKKIKKLKRAGKWQWD